jgi:two-component system cell cycle response regulator DivK
MPARILIIEDDPASRELARYLLDTAGYVTLIATDGGTGARMAIEEQPDLVLCDLHLPVMDGPAAIAIVRADPRWNPVPVVALTASSMAGDREKTLAAGFDDYLSKPITPETFVKQIEAFLPPDLRTGGKQPGG